VLTSLFGIILTQGYTYALVNNDKWPLNALVATLMYVLNFAVFSSTSSNPDTISFVEQEILHLFVSKHPL
jgi:hypothetical protein